MSLIQFFRILWARRTIVLVATLTCLVSAVIIGKLIPPRYVAQSRVMLDVVKPDPVTGEMIASQFARAYVKTQIELIKDYRIAGRAADILGWTNSAGMAARYRARDADDSRDFRRWLAQLVIDRTDAKLIEGSNILEISYSSSNPETAAKIADAVRQAYVEQAIAFKREDASNNAAWFRTQAGRLRQELTLAETRKTEFERANGIILDADNVDQESKRLAALASSAPAAPSAAAAPVVTPPNPMAAQVAQADAAIANAARTLGPNHPDLVAMRQQRNALASAAAASRPVVTSAGGGSTGPSLGQLYGAQQAKVLASRGKVDEARQLATDVAVLRDQYQKTAARATELQQQGESNDSGLTLLGNATAPQAAAFPNWLMLIAGSLGLGLTLGVLVALLSELLGRRVRGPEDLHSAGVPLLGMMTPGASPRRSWLDSLRGLLARPWQARAA